MAVLSQIKATSDNVTYNIRDDYSTWGGRNLVYNKTESSINGQLDFQYDILYGLENFLADLKQDDEIVISFEAKAASNVAGCTIYGYQGSGKTIGTAPTIALTTDWQYFSFNTTVKDYAVQYNNNGSIMFFYCTDSTARAVLKSIRKLKIEKGNKPTDWSPAPEDIARFIGNETIELYG